mgnify:CR=1 FL=1
MSVSILGLWARMIAVVLITAMISMAILLVVACSCVVWTAIVAIAIADMLAIVIVDR